MLLRSFILEKGNGGEKEVHSFAGDLAYVAGHL